MTAPQETIGTATEADLDGILQLQAANQAARGGRLAAELPRAHCRNDGQHAAGGRQAR